MMKRGKTPLLFHGLRTSSIAAGGAEIATFKTEVGRGTVREVMPFSVSMFQGFTFNILAGGMAGYQEEHGQFYQLQNKGFDGIRKRLWNIGEGQTVKIEANNGNPINAGYCFLGLMYSFPWYDEWRKNLRLNNQNSLKYQTYSFTTGAASANEQVFETINLPNNRGNCIGFQFQTSTLTTDLPAQDCFIRLLVDGVEVVKRLPFNYASVNSDPTIQTFYLPIAPGTPFQLGVIDTIGANLVYVRFLFNGWDDQV